MALSLNFSSGQFLTTGENWRFTDTTGVYDATDNAGGYGTPNPATSDILYTRHVFSDYIRERDAAESVSALEAYKEYKNVSGANFTYDGKTVAANALFIPLVAVSSVSAAINETGRYYTPQSFLPGDGTKDFTVAELGLTEDIFPDRVYSCTYEVYKTVTASGAIANGTQYVVKSATSTDRVTYSGSSYRPGEIFTGTGTTTFTTTGSPQVIKLEANVTKHFLLSYYSHLYVQELVRRLAQRKGNKSKDTFRAEVYNLKEDLDGLQDMVQENYLMITTSTDLIDHIAQEYNRLIAEYY